ncbi:ATPase RavA domain-containing protein [Candidatus Pantoea bituminis]|uniref:ATPase RavA domain-containing protein n=1 Tax=Candidatus Pantoea bituminis TaxID=2831036 RepID=UPI00351DA81E
MDLLVDAQHCLAVRDVSLQATRLTLPGISNNNELPTEIVEALDELDAQLRAQRHLFSQHQRCLFISDDWFARVESSLQDVAEQLKQARK